MAVEDYTPLNEATGYDRRPPDDHAKLRFLFTKTVVAVQGDANSTFGFGRLPPGNVRVAYPFCYIRASGTAFGASRVLDVGLGAYRTKQDQATVGDGLVAASANELANDIDISANGRFALSATLLKYDLYSLQGIPVTGLVAGGTSPVNAVLESMIAYLYD